MDVTKKDLLSYSMLSSKHTETKHMPCLAICSYIVETSIGVGRRITVKHKTMDKLQRLNNSKCDIPSL